MHRERSWPAPRFLHPERDSDDVKFLFHCKPDSPLSPDFQTIRFPGGFLSAWWAFDGAIKTNITADFFIWTLFQNHLSQGAVGHFFPVGQVVNFSLYCPKAILDDMGAPARPAFSKPRPESYDVPSSALSSRGVLS